MQRRALLVACLLLLEGPLEARASVPTLSTSRGASVQHALVKKHSSRDLQPLSRAESDELVPAAELAGAQALASVDPASGALTLHPGGLRALAEMPAPMCVVSVAGASHEGKSSFLNMLSHWLAERWPTVHGAGGDFKLGSAICEPGTEGAWVRVFTGQGGQPLPGTQCVSLALVDVAGVSRALGVDGPSAADVGAHRLFSLSTLASSTVALNLMTPVLNQLQSLAPAVLHAQRLLGHGYQQLRLADLPSLLFVGRDAPRAPSRGGEGADGAAVSEVNPLETAQLEYALLQPRGDALDATKRALMTLFPLERSLVQMTAPDEHDLDALGRGKPPPAHNIPGLPLSGARPFYASFERAATSLLSTLRPKSVGGHAVPGRELAHALVSLTDAINRDAPASLQHALYASLSRGARGAQSGIESPRTALLPA